MKAYVVAALACGLVSAVHADEKVTSLPSETPETFTVSGRVVGGPGAPPVPGAAIVVRGSDGRERTAKSGEDGVWWVTGLPAEQGPMFVEIIETSEGGFGVNGKVFR